MAAILTDHRVAGELQGEIVRLVAKELAGSLWQLREACQPLSGPSGAWLLGARSRYFFRHHVIYVAAIVAAPESSDQRIPISSRRLEKGWKR